jgi:hypothetical protein
MFSGTCRRVFWYKFSDVSGETAVSLVPMLLHPEDEGIRFF